MDGRAPGAGLDRGVGRIQRPEVEDAAGVGAIVAAVRAAELVAAGRVLLAVAATRLLTLLTLLTLTGLLAVSVLLAVVAVLPALGLLPVRAVRRGELLLLRRLREVGELTAQRLELRDELGVRIRRLALTRDRFLVRVLRRLLRVALQIAQRRGRDRLGRGDLRARAAQDPLGAVA